MADMGVVNMKKYVFILLIACLFIAQASAIQFIQYSYFNNNNISTRMYGQIVYNTVDRPLTTQQQAGVCPPLTRLLFPLLCPNSPITSPIFDSLVQQSSVESGQPYQMYILFSSYVDTWNTYAPTHRVNYCNLSIEYDKQGTVGRSVLFSDVFASTTDNAKYFVTLNPGDSAIVFVDCYFAGNRTLDMPADFTVVTPSWACKECQKYEWQKDYVKINKARTLGVYKAQVWGYLNGVFRVNYANLLAAYWIGMIMMVFLAVSLLFYAAFKVYKWIEDLAK